MEPVRLGVIGCGAIGPFHLEAAVASPLIEVVAVADRVEERVRRAAERFGVPRTYAEGDDLIEDPDVEAVVLALPACGRTSLALHAFARGKHVLIEKPIAMNAVEVEQLIRERGSLVAACCSSRFRFLEGARAAGEFIATGALGDLRVVRGRAFSSVGLPPAAPPPEWRLKRALNGGGILMNWGCYDLDYLLGITGWTLRPQSVFAQVWPISPHLEGHIAPGSDAETHYAALVRCAGGTVLSAERGEYAPIETENAWQVLGTRGSLRLCMTASNPKRVVFDEATPDRGLVTRVVWEGDEDAAAVHSGPVTDFAAAIREGRPPQTTLEQALVVQRISDAIYRSAETGTVVQVGG